MGQTRATRDNKPHSCRCCGQTLGGNACTARRVFLPHYCCLYPVCMLRRVPDAMRTQDRIEIMTQPELPPSGCLAREKHRSRRPFAQATKRETSRTQQRPSSPPTAPASRECVERNQSVEPTRADPGRPNHKEPGRISSHRIPLEVAQVRHRRK